MAAAGFTWDHELLGHIFRAPTEDERVACEVNGHAVARHHLYRRGRDGEFPRHVVGNDDHQCTGGYLTHLPVDPVVVSEESEAAAGLRTVHQRWVGHLYFMRNGEGLIKIGRSARPRERLLQIRYAEAIEVSLLLVIPDGGDLELALHHAFASERVRGEWFRPVESLTSLVAEVSQDGRSVEALVAAMRRLGVGTVRKPKAEEEAEETAVT